MQTYADADRRIEGASGGHVPAYGPVEALFGYTLFYVVVDRATPTITATFAEILAVPPSLVGLGLAVLLWFVLLATGFDQVRRQLAALGYGSHDAVTRDADRFGTPSEGQALGYLALLLVGSVVVVWTFETALATTVSMIRIVTAVDPSGFVLEEIAVMVLFFVAFGVATRALDRLVIGGLRELLAD